MISEKRSFARGIREAGDIRTEPGNLFLDPKPALQPARPSNENDSEIAPSRNRRTGIPTFFRPSVLLRVTVAAAVVGVAGTYLYDRAMLNTSTDAIVSAPLVPLRAPIDGQVFVALGAQPGSFAAPGTRLFTVNNDRTDSRSLADLQAQVRKAADGKELISMRIAALRSMEGSLERRIEIHRRATISRLEAASREAGASLLGAVARLKHATLEANRVEELSRRGAASAARVEEVRATQQSLQAEVERMHASIQGHVTELEAARAGVIIGEGYSDAPYSLQRMDEIRMRIADLKAEYAAAEASERELSKRLALEEKRMGRLTEDVVVNASAGILWNVRVGDGAWVSTGEALADFADCTKAFVEATFPERGFGTIRPGDTVTVRLHGGSDDFSGVIRSVRGAGASTSSSFRAGGLERVSAGMMAVVVDLKSPLLELEGCDLGRRAAVEFDRRPRPAWLQALTFSKL